MAKHQNNGACEKCMEIMNRYVGLDLNLKGWFLAFQARHPEAHVSCAGRGYRDQMDAYKSGASRAKFGQSGHNYNCALDLFVNERGRDLYDEVWFFEVLLPELPSFLRWYGMPGHPFRELPHVEVTNWHHLKDKGLIFLVEDPDDES